MSDTRTRALWQQPNILGQLTLNFYAVIMLGFRLTEQQPVEKIDLIFQQALDQLTEHFAFLAGRVIVNGRTSNSSGTYAVSPYKDSKPRISLDVEDLTSVMPSLDTFASGNVPMSMLTSGAWAPIKGLPRNYFPWEEDSPVLRVKMNLLTGGCTLTFCAQHNMMDMNGLGNLITLFAKGCRSEAYTDMDMAGSRLDTASMIPRLPENRSPLPYPEFRSPSQLENSLHHTPLKAPWRCYRFKVDVLAKLKHAAISSQQDTQALQRLSANDALTAFIWQCVSRARTARLGPQAETKIVRMANALSRADIGIPPSYMGFHCVPMLSPSYTLASISTASLSELTVTLRKQLQTINQQFLKNWATLISNEPDKSTIGAAASVVFGADMIFSSWAGLGLASLSFGEQLGRPEFIRRPQMGGSQGLCYFMPKTVDGHIDISLSLTEEDWDCLERDEEWSRVSEAIG